MTRDPTAIHAARPKPPAEATLPNLGPLLEANQLGLARWFHGMFEISQEISQFAQNRLREDAAAWLQLASCRSAEDALDCQQRFVERAMRQYFEEATRLSQLAMNVASAGAPATHRHG
jgi:hypothetical protein